MILEEVEGRKGSLHVEVDTANRIDDAERRWIQQFVAAGHPLTNSQQVSDDKRLMVETEERGRELIAALGVDPQELLED